MKKLTFLSFIVAVLGLMTCVAGLSSCHEGSRTSNGSEQVDTLLDKETLSMVLSAIAKGDLDYSVQKEMETVNIKLKEKDKRKDSYNLI